MDKWAALFSDLVDWYFKKDLLDEVEEDEEDDASDIDGEIERCYAEIMQLYEQGEQPFDPRVYAQEMLRAFLQEKGISAVRVFQDFCRFQQALELFHHMLEMRQRFRRLGWMEWFQIEPDRNTFYPYAEAYISGAEERYKTGQGYFEEELGFIDLLSELFDIQLSPELESLITFTFEDVPNAMMSTTQRPLLH